MKRNFLNPLPLPPLMITLPRRNNREPHPDRPTSLASWTTLVWMEPQATPHPRTTSGEGAGLFIIARDGTGPVWEKRATFSVPGTKSHPP